MSINSNISHGSGIGGPLRFGKTILRLSIYHWNQDLCSVNKYTDGFLKFQQYNFSIRQKLTDPERL